jgi:type IX secretion system PorP/SprF family membrane protein
MKSNSKYVSIRFIILFTFLVLLLNGITLRASQPTNMYRNMYASFNPACSGIFNNYHGVSSLSTLKVPGELPFSFLNSFDCNVDALHGGIGFNYNMTTISPINAYDFNFNYSCHIKAGEGKIIGVGISGGYYRSMMDLSNIVLDDEDPEFRDENFDSNDDFGIAIGTVFKSKRLETGYSLNKMLKNNGMDYLNKSIVFFSYNTDLSEMFNVSPGACFEFNPHKKYLNANLIVTYKNRFWMGGIYLKNF